VIRNLKLPDFKFRILFDLVVSGFGVRRGERGRSSFSGVLVAENTCASISAGLFLRFEDF
jgi:hypothetical protein